MIQSLGNLVPFVSWFGTSIVLMAAFFVIYRQITPHPEIKLIQEGNVSAAVAFGGTLLGYALPLASVMVHGANIVDFTIWGLIAMVVQLGVYYLLRWLFKDYSRHIAEDHLAVAIFGAFVSLAVGVLNAAAQSS